MSQHEERPRKSEPHELPSLATGAAFSAVYNAILDPGHYIKQLLNFPPPLRQMEPVARWQTRAVLAALGRLKEQETPAPSMGGREQATKALRGWMARRAAVDVPEGDELHVELAGEVFDLIEALPVVVTDEMVREAAEVFYYHAPRDPPEPCDFHEAMRLAFEAALNGKP